MKKRLVHGVGINDSDNPVYRYGNIDGKWRVVWKCNFYETWCGMMKRCYSKKLHQKRPTYSECNVHEQWHKFSQFKEWMILQDWIGNQLDKDIIVRGNKIYSPDTCVFVSMQVNNFIIDSGSARGNTPIGVSWNSRDSKYQAKIMNPFTGKQDSLGYYSCQFEAHKAWQARKHEHAMSLAGMQENNIVAEALRSRYAPENNYL